MFQRQLDFGATPPRFDRGKRTGGIVSPARTPYLSGMPGRRKTEPTAKLMAEWPLSPAATLGSSMRARGIFLEIRARLPAPLRKLLHIESRVLALRLPDDSDADVEAAAAILSKAMRDIEDLPVIPREVEDILTISAGERHRWLKGGRLQSAGTRTVKLRGRARKITFHVFDPRHIEDVLDRDLVTVWREEDAATAAVNRRRAAARAALKRAQKRGGRAANHTDESREDAPRPRGWEDFDMDGLLR